MHNLGLNIEGSTVNFADIVIIGGGAAGLMTSIWAARTNSKLKIVIVDGAKKLGAKILVAGGGRCNVTHVQMDASDFAGSSQNSIRKILLRFDVKQTTDFFRQLGVELKKEKTGKLFPISDSARDVLNALMAEAKRLNVHIYCNHRVEQVAKIEQGFLISGDWGQVISRKMVIATGGKSLPKSGSDGKGYEFCQRFGHSLTKNIFPALVPLLLPEDHFICQLSGLSTKTELSIVDSKGKVLKSFSNSVLCTHFGISGPVALDISRYFLDAHLDVDAQSKLKINWLPDFEKKQVNISRQSREL